MKMVANIDLYHFAIRMTFYGNQSMVTVGNLFFAYIWVCFCNFWLQTMCQDIYHQNAWFCCQYYPIHVPQLWIYMLCCRWRL